MNFFIKNCFLLLTIISYLSFFNELEAKSRHHRSHKTQSTHYSFHLNVEPPKTVVRPSSIQYAPIYQMPSYTEEVIFYTPYYSRRIVTAQPVMIIPKQSPAIHYGFSFSLF